MKQSRKDKLLDDVGPSSKNELKTTNPIGESKNHTNIKPVTVLRISERELRKSCKDMQEELATQEVIAEEKTVVNDKSWSVVDCTELLAKLTISNSEVGDKDTSAVTNGPSNVSYSKGNPFLYRTDIVKAHLPGNSDEDEDGVGVRLGNGKEVKHLQTQNSSQDFTEDNQERASSPSNSDGSDEVFTNTSKPASTEIDAGHKNQVLAALHRGEFKKPRRPFKSDSSVISRTESIEASTTLLSDTKDGRCNNKSTLARSQSEVATSFEHKNMSCGLATETDPVTVAILNDTDKDSKIVSNESKVGNEQDHSTGNVTENWREILPATDNSLGDQNADRSEKQDCNERTLSFSTADPDSQEHKNGQSSGTQNWRERPQLDLKESDSSNQSNNTSNENWRERTSDHLGNLWRKSSHPQNWWDRKSISMDESRKDAACNPSFGGSSKRYSTGDIPLERQDSNEKGL